MSVKKYRGGRRRLFAVRRVKKTILIAIACAAGLAFMFASCATQPAERPAGLPAETAAPEKPPEGTAEKPPERVVPAVPEYIMGKGIVKADQLASFLRSANEGLNPAFAQDLARCYVEEADAEGVNHDVAFAQMCLETGFQRYGGLVTPDMNNFCGLGSIGPGVPGESFPDPRTGVRAHIQHLKGYASADPLTGELVDPRYRWVKHGSSPRIEGLAGTWAADREYAKKIDTILKRMYQESF